jgi:hypothetical protein
MVDKREVPTGWGLAVRGPNGWYSLKRPQRRGMTPEQAADLYLAVHLCQAEKPWRHSRETRIRLAHNAQHLTAMGMNLGGEVGAALRDHSAMKGESDCAREIICRLLGRDPETAGTVYWLAAELEREVRRAGLLQHSAAGSVEAS